MYGMFAEQVAEQLYNKDMSYSREEPPGSGALLDPAVDRTVI